MIRALRKAWRRLRSDRSAPHLPAAFRLTDRSELPDDLDPQRLYLIGEPPKWAVLKCPCGTGHQIDLNLSSPGRPRWTVTFDTRSRPSLSPSVNVTGDRRCHFWIRHGHVRWCADTRTQLGAPGKTATGRRIP